MGRVFKIRIQFLYFRPELDCIIIFLLLINTTSISEKTNKYEEAQGNKYLFPIHLYNQSFQNETNS
jgi:hypothetical protein